MVLTGPIVGAGGDAAGLARAKLGAVALDDAASAERVADRERGHQRQGAANHHAEGGLEL